MKKIIKKWKETDMTYRLLALFLAVVLFLNTTNASLQSTLYRRTESYSETINNVPVTLDYDSDEYYVHGYENSVKVNLTSMNRIQLDSEVNEDTRNFKVVADLTKLGIGTHEVKLRVSNLRSAVTGSVQPQTITVTIEKKVTKTMDVEPVLASSALADGFKLDKITAAPSQVEITTGEDTFKQISRVVATVDPSKAATDDFSDTVNVEALDDSGQILSVISEPEQVKVSVKVIAPKKTVDLKVNQQGSLSTGVSSYEITLSEEKATISGAKSVIDAIDSISIPVDVSNISTTTTKTIEIPKDNYSVSPESVKVTIKPIYSSDSSSSQSNSGSTNQNNQTGGNTTNNNSNNNQGTKTSDSKTTTSSDSTTQSSEKVTTQDSGG